MCPWYPSGWRRLKRSSYGTPSKTSYLNTTGSTSAKSTKMTKCSMHKNESCSEDGNYYENQLAELMDLRQAVRLESNPNSSTSPSTSWTKTPPTMSTTTTTTKVMLLRKSQLSTKIIRWELRQETRMEFPSYLNTTTRWEPWQKEKKGIERKWKLVRLNKTTPCGVL